MLPGAHKCYLEHTNETLMAKVSIGKVALVVLNYLGQRGIWELESFGIAMAYYRALEACGIL